MNTQKICFFLSSFRAGGGEKAMILLANWFAEHDYAVEVVVLKGVGEYAAMLDERIVVRDMNAWRILFSLPKLTGYLRLHRPDVLMATDEYTHILAIVARLCARSSTRIVLRIGNMYSELYQWHGQGLKKRITFFLIRTLYAHADAAVANSGGVAADIISLTGIAEEKVAVIFNPKPVATIQKKATQKTGIAWCDESTLPLLVSVGRLRKQKNFPLLVRAFARVLAAYPCRLVIVGGGREQEKLKELIHTLRLEDDVLLAGFQENPYAFLARARAYVHVSLWEGMPNAVMEAMVCGAPIIAADCPSGPRELLAPETDWRTRLKHGIEYAQYGVLVPVGGEDELVSALSRLLADDAMRESYAEKSKERTAAFEINRIAERYRIVLFP